MIAAFDADGRDLFVADGSVVRAAKVRGDGTWTEVLWVDDTITALATTAAGSRMAAATKRPEDTEPPGWPDWA